MSIDTSDKGLDYYSLNINCFESDEFLLLEEALGELSVLKFLKLRAVIYREGYFFKWDENSSRLFCKKRQYNIEEMNQVIKKCCIIGLLSLEMYEWYGILTALDIQESYVFVASKRKYPKIIQEYLLIPKEAWKDYKITTKFAIINIKKEVLLISQLPAIIRPKKKIYVIEQSNLFSADDIPSQEQPDRKSIIADSIIEYTSQKKINGNHIIANNSVPLVTGEFIPEDTDLYSIEDAVLFCSGKYEDKSEEFKENISVNYYMAYRIMIDWINNEFVNLKISKYQVTFKQFKELFIKTKFGEDELYKALEKLSCTGITNVALMKSRIAQYLKYIQSPDTQSTINNNNPNHVKRLN